MAKTQEIYNNLGEDSRMIVAFMFFAGVFAIIGYEKKSKTNTTQKIANPAEIVLGGTVAAVALTLLSHAGEGGKKFAVGLAGVTFASSVLINGSSVFTSVKILEGATGTAASTPSTPSNPSNPSTPSKPTTPSTPSGVK